MTYAFATNSGWIVYQLLTYLGFLLALVFLAHILRGNRSPSSTMAWLLVIMLLPYVGVPLFLLFGGRKLRRMARRKEPVYRRDARPALDHSERAIERVLLSQGVHPATPGNRVELVGDGVSAYEHLVRLIDAAKHSIHITTYILGRDAVGEALVARLARRASEGIAVRLLLDDVGSWRVARTFVEPLRASGAQVAFFMPVVHIPFRGRTNLRNHRKVVVIDDAYSLTGGMNLAEEYMGPTLDPARWRDLSLVSSGPVVADFAELFRSDWKFATGEELAPAPAPASALALPSRTDPAAGCVAQVVASGPDVAGDPLYESLVTAIFAAKTRVWVVTPYFVPDEVLARALELAIRRGVRVRLLVPAHSNHLMADLARASYLRQVHDAGGLVLRYYPGMVHAKAVIVDDDLAVIGSANMDMRSLFLNYEVALFLYSRAEVERAAAWVESLMAECLAGLETRSHVRELAEDVVRLVSPLL